MNSPLPAPKNRIAEVRRKRGLSQAALAELVGAHWITISKLERGQMQLTDTWLDRLSEALHVGPADLLKRFKSLSTIFVDGIIRVGGSGLLYEEPRSWGIEPPGVYDANTIWLVVEGEALWPLFQDGDLIRFVQIESDEIVSNLGRLTAAAVSRPIEGKSTLIGFIDAGSRADVYDIRPMNLPPHRDIEVVSAWIAVEARFRPSWMKGIAKNA